eukprot:TRINITY_DN15145_c0_g1_i15.p1 TRINITY_DN15145_c0_g1~~TRINITY_DN15145_c0_g1_i15.p1  ORF type:complete len:100 (+),score=2.98 TRINITY_DN15145_c0_g1_i15:105-404(+)
MLFCAWLCIGIAFLLVFLFYFFYFLHLRVFVLSHHIQIFSAGEKLPDLPSLGSSLELPVNSREKSASLDVLGPNPGTEINLDWLSISFSFPLLLPYILF